MPSIGPKKITKTLFNAKFKNQDEAIELELFCCLSVHLHINVAYVTVNKKSEIVLMGRVTAYSSSCSAVRKLSWSISSYLVKIHSL